MQEQIDWCWKRMESFVRTPKMWAKELESLEFQAVQVVEFLAITTMPVYLNKNPRCVIEAYASYTKTRFKQNKPAYEFLKTHEEIAEHVMNFAKKYTPFMMAHMHDK